MRHLQQRQPPPGLIEDDWLGDAGVEAVEDGALRLDKSAGPAAGPGLPAVPTVPRYAPDLCLHQSPSQRAMILRCISEVPE